MPNTRKVKTNSLRVTYPGELRKIVWCTGSVAACAELAVLDLQRTLRRLNLLGADESLPDKEGDKLEADLRKRKKAELRGFTFEVVPEVEEYDVAEGEDATDTDEDAE